MEDDVLARQDSEPKILQLLEHLKSSQIRILDDSMFRGGVWWSQILSVAVAALGCHVLLLRLNRYCDDAVWKGVCSTDLACLTQTIPLFVGIA